MYYPIIKPGEHRTAGKMDVLSVPDKDGAVVTLTLNAPATSMLSTINIYVKTTGGEDLVPIILNAAATPGKPYQLKGIFIQSRQTLVIESNDPVDYLVQGSGFAATTAKNTPQGRMFNLRQWKTPGSPFMVFELPDFGSSQQDAWEGDFFINGLAEEPSKVDIKGMSTIPVNDTQFNTGVWLLTTIVGKDFPPKVFRKITYGNTQKYVIVRCNQEDVSIFFQYNLRWHNLT